MHFTRKYLHIIFAKYVLKENKLLQLDHTDKEISYHTSTH